MENQNPNIILENNARVNDHAIDLDGNYGPLELSLLERVETGLTRNNIETFDESESGNRGEADMQFEKKKEIIFVTGWVNVKSVYERYMWGFICKILIGLTVIYALLQNNQNMMPVVILFCVINSVHVLKNLFFVFYYRRSTQDFKSIFVIEFNIYLSYLIYFTGFLLLYKGDITNRYLPLFSLPVLVSGVVLFVLNSAENTFISQKKFHIFEALQLFLISLKFSEVGFVNWNYTLLFYMSASIYMTVLGILLSIILSCSLFGFLYRSIEIWKIKSLLWMTWYYVWSGMVYIYFIKGVVQLYHEEDFYEPAIIGDFINAKSNNYEVLMITSIFMILFSVISLILHFTWKKEIKRFLGSIIYKEELRKEVSLKLFKDSFTYKMIKLSTTYFIKPSADQTAKEAEKNHAIDTELCEFCCVKEPDIVFEKCGHGGLCQQCLVKYVSNGDAKCPWCKQKIHRVLLINYCSKTSSFTVKGEIDIKT